MKQIINKYPNGKIENKYYLNNLNQFNSITIYYWNNGNIHWKLNYLNGKRFSLDYWYGNNNNKLINITYHL